MYISFSGERSLSLKKRKEMEGVELEFNFPFRDAAPKSRLVVVSLFTVVETPRRKERKKQNFRQVDWKKST